MAASAASPSGPVTRKCSVAPCGAFTRITFTGLLASVHGPSAASASSILAAKPFAHCVSLTEGRACRPTGLTRTAEAVSGAKVSAARPALTSCIEFLRATLDGSERRAARRFGRGDHGALDHRGIADHDARAPVFGQHLHRHF